MAYPYVNKFHFLIHCFKKKTFNFKIHKNLNSNKLLISIECGLSSRIHAPTGRIVNGTNAYKGEFPWQASIMLYRGIQSGFDHYCGGVLIAKNWIATAAHCVAR